MKLIMENWRKFKKELEESSDPEQLDEFLGFFKEECWCVDSTGQKVGEVSSSGKCRGASIKKCEDEDDEAPEKEYSAATRAKEDFATHHQRLRRASSYK